MWTSLIIFHSNNFSRFRGSVEGLVDWHTCMRSVYIGDQRLTSMSAYYSLSDYEVFTGYKAYSVLLEIVSGIRSKLFGESEIQFQFNERFSKENLLYSPLTESILKLKNHILEHVKQIRSEFIKGKGRQTYGGIADSILPGNINLAILGTGQLAESMIVHLLKKNRKVSIVGRNTKRLNFFREKFNILTLDYNNFHPSFHSIIIANPHLPENLIQKLTENSIVLDFRADEIIKNNIISDEILYFSFQSILSKIQATKENEEFLKPQIINRIHELTEERENEVLQNPNGWEDINWMA
jgi:glutamyl-tRNA reductase